MITSISFSSLSLTKPILQAIDEMGFSEATPVQTQVIPEGNNGRDILAAAQTGTGKTLAYLVPIFDQMVRFYGSKRPKGNKGPYALILAPTRELAQQIATCASTIALTAQFRVTTAVGGKKYSTQISNLKKGCDILIATPGRLIDLLDQNILSLRNIHYFVLDEVDRMMDMGFWPSVSKLVKQLPAERQTFLLSATLSQEVLNKASLIQHDPVHIETTPATETADTVQEFLLPVATRQKQDLLLALLQEKGSQRVLVFTHTKQEADLCAHKLQNDHINAESIHSDKPQRKRDKILERFKNGTLDVLVATDVLARGIDITDVHYVINFTVPESPDDYIHRIGRTGRAGVQGAAYTLMAPEELLTLREIEYHTANLLELYDVPEFAYDVDRLVPNPNRPTKRGARRTARTRRLRLGKC